MSDRDAGPWDDYADTSTLANSADPYAHFQDAPDPGFIGGDPRMHGGAGHHPTAADPYVQFKAAPTDQYDSGHIPPPPDGSGIVPAGGSGNLPPPPDGSGIVPTHADGPWNDYADHPGSPAPREGEPQQVGDLGFNTPSAPASHLSPEDEATLHHLYVTADASTITRFLASKNFKPRDNLEAYVAQRDKAIQAQRKFDTGISYARPDPHITELPADLKQGAGMAAARGYISVVPGVGHITAAARALDNQLGLNGATPNERGFWDEYNFQSDLGDGAREGDAADHPYASLAGSLVGSLAIPTGLEGVGYTAGRDAIRAGATLAEARGIAASAVRNRLSATSAAYGGAKGALDANSPSEALTGGVTGALIGGATGATVGQVAKLRGPALDAARLAARAAPAADGEASEIAGLARDQKIDIMPQDIGGPTVQRSTQAAAQTPYGASVVKRAANRLYTSFKDRVGEIAGPSDSPVDVGNTIKSQSAAVAGREAERADATSGAVLDAAGTPSDETGAGQGVQRGIGRWIQDTAARANELYSAVPISAARPASVTNTRQVLGDLTSEMESNPRLSALFQSPRLQSYLRALTPETETQATGLLDASGNSITRDVQQGGNLSWQDLQEFRTRVGDMLDEPRLSDKIAPRQLRALYGGLTQDMEATARSEGPQAYRGWKRANDYYDGRMKRIRDTASIVTGDRSDKTPNEAYAALQGLLRTGSTGDASAFSRIMRSVSPDDAATVRATLVQSQRGGPQFDPAKLSSNWSKISERGKSALLPQPGLRSIMDDAANRATSATHDPFADKSGEQVYLSLERLAENRGDSLRFHAHLARMSPDEANSVRSLMINRMGLATAGAQGADGDTFSIGRFLTRWNTMSPGAKSALFGNAEMRGHMEALARIAERVKASEKLAGHSNTGGVEIANRTNAGLGAAAVALLMGHPIAAAGLASPAAYQRISAEVLTSKRLLTWIARAPAKATPPVQRAYIAQLSHIARAEPTIANQVLHLQQRLNDAFSGGTASMPTRAAAIPASDEPADEGRQ